MNFTVGGLYSPGGQASCGSSKAADLILGGWNIGYFLSAHAGFPSFIAASAQTNTGQSVRGNAPTTTAI